MCTNRGRAVTEQPWSRLWTEWQMPVNITFPCDWNNKMQGYRPHGKSWIRHFRIEWLHCPKIKLILAQIHLTRDSFVQLLYPGGWHWVLVAHPGDVRLHGVTESGEQFQSVQRSVGTCVMQSVFNILFELFSNCCWFVLVCNAY